MHYACSVSALVCLQLLSNGADVTIADLRGKTPLHLAAKQHDKTIVHVLLDSVSENKELSVSLVKTSSYNRVGHLSHFSKFYLLFKLE